jgi:hypothetical protein
MISDAYENAHYMWEDDDLSSSSSPNDAQVVSRMPQVQIIDVLSRKRLDRPFEPGWLMLISSRHYPENNSLHPYVIASLICSQKAVSQISPYFQYSEASSLTASNSLKTPSRTWSLPVGSLKLPRKRAYSWSTSSTSPRRSLLSLSPLKSWRRRRESTASSFTTVSEPSIPIPPFAPSKSSSRSLPVRSYTVCRSKHISLKLRTNPILRNESIKNGHGSQRRYLPDKKVRSMTSRYHPYHKLQLNLYHQHR